MSDTARLLTTREVADFLGVSPETVLRRWRAGELPGYRLASNVLRFREDEIGAWLESCRVCAISSLTVDAERPSLASVTELDGNGG